MLKTRLPLITTRAQADEILERFTLCLKKVLGPARGRVQDEKNF